MGICKLCGSDRPLLNGGICSPCLRAFPVRDRTAVSYSAGASVPGLEAHLAAQAETNENVSTAIAALTDTMKNLVRDDDDDDDAPDAADLSGPDEEDAGSLPGWVLPVVVGVAVVGVIVFVFRDAVVGLIKKVFPTSPAAIAAGTADCPIGTIPGASGCYMT
jgi:hypothetical protein